MAKTSACKIQASITYDVFNYNIVKLQTATHDRAKTLFRLIYAKNLLLSAFQLTI
jgi:hypothetical protein